MNDPVQCPNCGGYKVVTASKVKAYGYRTRPMSFRAYVAWWAIFLGFLFILLTMLMYIYRLSLLLAIVVAVIFSVLILWSPSMRSKLFERQYLDRAPIDAVYRHSCQLCDYQWTWRTGTPKPTVQVRPDLILLGAERLGRKRRR